VLETETVWGWGRRGQLRARRRAGLIIEGAQLSSGQRALDIGCGTGLFTEMFASRGAEIVAVDISGELLDKARARNLPAGQVTFLERLPGVREFSGSLYIRAKSKWLSAFSYWRRHCHLGRNPVLAES
jgi:SAM-dependent methyltransferase